MAKWCELVTSLALLVVAIAGVWAGPLEWPEAVQNAGVFLAWWMAVILALTGIGVASSEKVRDSGGGPVDRVLTYSLGFGFALSAAAVGWFWIAGFAASGLILGGCARLGAAMERAESQRHRRAE